MLILDRVIKKRQEIIIGLCEVNNNMSYNFTQLDQREHLFNLYVDFVKLSWLSEICISIELCFSVSL